MKFRVNEAEVKIVSKIYSCSYSKIYPVEIGKELCVRQFSLKLNLEETNVYCLPEPVVNPIGLYYHVLVSMNCI